MKKIFLFIILQLMLFHQLFAKSIDRVTALHAATTIYNSFFDRDSPYSQKDFDLIYIGEYEDITGFYMFNLKDAPGFIIISADNNMLPLIAISEESNIELKDNYKTEIYLQWMQQYSFLASFINQFAIENPENQMIWQDIINKFELKSNKKSDYNHQIVVNKIIGTQWGQDDYYNAFAPSNQNGNHAHIGCVAVAMSQIMKHYNLPVHGFGSHSYNYSNNTYSASFDNFYYNWNNMPNKLSSSNTDVATLCYHACVAVEMNWGWGSNGSGAFSETARNAMVSHFGFSSNSSLIARANTNNWSTILKNQLLAKQPVYYDGTWGGNGGHAFICDGFGKITTSELLFVCNTFHFNYGWDGDYDGWYTIDYEHINNNYNGIIYNQVAPVQHRAIINLYPCASYFNITNQSSLPPNQKIFTKNFTNISSIIESNRTVVLSSSKIILLNGFHAQLGSKCKISNIGCDLTIDDNIDNKSNVNKQNTVITNNNLNEIKLKNENEPIEFKILSNPNNGNFIIQLPFDSTNYQIQIINSLGIIIYKGTFTSDKIIFNNFKKGVYLVLISNEKSINTQKIIVN